MAMLKSNWAELYFIGVGGYMLAAYLVTQIIYTIFYRYGKLKAIKIQSKYPVKSHLKSEIKLTYLTLLIQGAAGATVIPLFFMKWNFLYSEILKYGITYTIVTVVLLMILHDAYFYWTHRLMHSRPFVGFHMVHHRSNNPSPWTTFSIHPIEALINGLFVPIVTFCIPINWISLLVYLIYLQFVSVMGHTGFEIFSRKFPFTFWGKLQTTPTHHNLHHKFFKGNYGIYLNVWDLLMKTERTDYYREFEKVFEHE